jgi:hypothetical protein
MCDPAKISPFPKIRKLTEELKKKVKANKAEKTRRSSSKRKSL